MKVKTKFIIYGQGRSGSNLLRSLLNSHPDVYCDHEIFNNNRVRKKGKVKQSLIQISPLIYIDYLTYKVPIKIYGFKLLHHQLTNIDRILTRLQQKGWLIIHLHRENLIRQAVSWYIANSTKLWVRNEKTGQYNEKIYIDPQKLLQLVEKRKAINEKEKILMKKLEHLEVVYENDLYDASQWGQTTKKIFGYLNTYPVEVSTKKVKTSSLKDEERIENFDEMIGFLKRNGQEMLVERYLKLNKLYP